MGGAIGTTIAIAGVASWFVRRRQRRAHAASVKETAHDPSPISPTVVDTIPAFLQSRPFDESLASSVPFLSPSLRLRPLPGRGVGFLASSPIRAGELLLIDSVLSVPTDDHVAYDWHAHAELVRQLHELNPQVLQELYVSNESQAAIESEHPIPDDLRVSPILGLSDAQWVIFLHAMANNAYIRDEEDDEYADDGADLDDSASFLRRGLSSSSSRSSMSLLLLTCKFNHSCMPAACSSNGRVYACADIAVGEEVCVSYLLPEQALFLPTPARQALLHTGRHFACTCRRCAPAEDDATMHELEAAVTRTTLDDATLRALEERVERDLESDTLETDECRELLAVFDAAYDAVPASHWLRFSLRRRLLLTPPSWLTRAQYARCLLEHWCVVQMILPPSHLYKAIEADELAEANEHSNTGARLLTEDLHRLLARLDDAFAPMSPLMNIENEEVRAAMQRRFAAPMPTHCTRTDCPHADTQPASPSVASSAASFASTASSSSSRVTTFVCAACQVPLVACSPECHAALVAYHTQICSLLALTCSG